MPPHPAAAEAPVGLDRHGVEALQEQHEPRQRPHAEGRVEDKFVGVAAASPAIAACASAKTGTPAMAAPCPRSSRASASAGAVKRRSRAGTPRSTPAVSVASVDRMVSPSVQSLARRPADMAPAVELQALPGCVSDEVRPTRPASSVRPSPIPRSAARLDSCLLKRPVVRLTPRRSKRVVASSAAAAKMIWVRPSSSVQAPASAGEESSVRARVRRPKPAAKHTRLRHSRPPTPHLLVHGEGPFQGPRAIRLFSGSKSRLSVVSTRTNRRNFLFQSEIEKK